MDGFYPSAYAHGKVNYYRPITSLTSRSLDGVYVDGISITYGNPRKHVWTYAVGSSDDYNYTQTNCPCAKYPGPDPPIYNCSQLLHIELNLLYCYSFIAKELIITDPNFNVSSCSCRKLMEEPWHSSIIATTVFTSTSCPIP